MRLELGLARKGGAVDALQLRLARIATPIGTGDLGQLEGADPPGRGAVRAAAEIEPLALMIQRDRLIRRDRVQELVLEGFSQIGKAAMRLVAADVFAAERLVGLDDRCHLGLDPRQILWPERLVAGEIVVEAVLDRGPDGDLGAGKQPLHRLGHDMRAVVTQQGQGVRVFGRDQPHLGIGGDRPVEIAERAVHLDGERLLGQALGDRGRDLATRGGALEPPLAAIGKCNDHCTRRRIGGALSYRCHKSIGSVLMMLTV